MPAKKSAPRRLALGWAALLSGAANWAVSIATVGGLACIGLGEDHILNGKCEY